ncbi:MAG: hypothetical protein ABSD75_22265 [Terriglobales bacterium]
MRLFANAAAILLGFGLWAPKTAVVSSLPAPSSLPRVDFIVSRGPRDMEELTRQKIVHDYAEAWQTLALGLEQNRAELLNGYFTGFAKQEFGQTIAEQGGIGIHRHYVDHGHRLQALFYSPDGGVMQLQDDTEYEVQVFDGARLLHVGKVSVRFLVLMTPAADRWMVRLMQSVPAT